MINYRSKYVKYKSKYLALNGGGNNMKNTLDSLLNSKTKWYDTVNIDISKEDRDVIDKLKIPPGKAYNFYGKVNESEQKRYMKDFIKTLKKDDDNDDDDSNKVSNIIVSKLIMPFLQACDMDSAWILIRVTEPYNEYDIPRWHCDGNFYQPSAKSKPYAGQYKIILALRGPGTLFMKENKDALNKLNDIYDMMRLETQEKTKDINKKDIDKLHQISFKIQDSFRTKIADEMKDFPREQANNNEAVIFMSGDMDRCLIHSEPPIDANRIFISIVPGNNRDITDMAKLRNQKMDKPIY